MKMSDVINGGRSMVNYLRRGNQNISADSVVGLTETGRKRADDESEAGIKYDILVSLQHGEKTVRDLANDINAPVDDVKKELQKMRGLVRCAETE